MSSSLMSSTPRPDAPPALPWIHAGDHLDAETFHARYAAMPFPLRAELVRGVVIVASPTNCPHGLAHANVVTWCGVYKSQTPGVESFDNTTTRLNSEDEYQPDVQLNLLPESGGEGVQAGAHIAGAPHFVIEVASSSAAYDLYEKYGEYERAGVLEYVVVTLEEREVHWHRRVDGRFTRIEAEPDGTLRSSVFPGLWMNTKALSSNQLGALLATLQLGLQSPEHAAFVEQLAARRQQEPPSP